LKKIIAAYEKIDPGVNKQYLIKGDPNARYPIFEKIIEALKQNNIYKYKLVATD